MSHFSKEKLDRYLHQDVNFITRQKIKNHLSNCKECKLILEELQGDDKLLIDIRNLKKRATPEKALSSKSYTELSSILGKAKII